VTGQDFLLTKGLLVTGKFVYVGTDVPVPDGYLTILQVPGLVKRQRVEAAPDGTFSFRQPPGEGAFYTYVHNRSGYVPREQVRRELTLTAGQPPAELTVEVEPWLVFKGRVIGPDGEGVAGAIVNQLHRKWLSVETGADGAFELPLRDVRAAQGTGGRNFTSLEARHPDMPGHRGMIGMTLETGADAQGTIQLAPAVIVRGRVVDVEGDPIPGAAVMNWLDFGNFASSDKLILADEAGYYEFRNAPKGTPYGVEATAAGYGQDRQQRIPITGEEEVTVTDLVLQVADQFIEGLVIDEDGDPVAEAHVYTYPGPSGDRNTDGDEQGRFRLENLVDGQIRISAFSNVDGVYVSGQVTAYAGDTGVEIMLGEQQRATDPEEQEVRRLAGKSAPELDAVEWVHREATSLAALRGKTVVLAFWDYRSEKCADLMGSLNGLSSEYAGRGVEMLSVHGSGADTDALKAFISDNSIEFRVACDKRVERHRGATFEKYRVRKVPAIFIIDSEGKVRYQDIPLAAVGQALETLLKED
jgi:peroxiredoxin/protocatechuate 3,4-dioxygenase beta subunit